MKLGVIGDMHGNLRNLKKVIKKLDSENIDALFITGDIAGTIHWTLILKSIWKYKNISRARYVDVVYGEGYQKFTEFQKKSITKTFELLANKDYPIFFTHGNSETKETRILMAKLAKENNQLFYLENGSVTWNKLQVVGYGYCMPSKYRTPFKTPGEKSEEAIKKDLQKLEKDIDLNKACKEQTLIGIFHEPPINTKADYIPHKKIHGGSPYILDHINKVQYDYIFTGHIHESQAFEYRKKTLLVNPGALVEGKWAVINTESHTAKLYKLRTSISLSKTIYMLRALFP
ncbi:MAG: metallophosphoesterase family protein [Candidatus Heimdallarchaeaceae archaeon]